MALAIIDELVNGSRRASSPLSADNVSLVYRLKQVIGYLIVGDSSSVEFLPVLLDNVFKARAAVSFFEPDDLARWVSGYQKDFVWRDFLFMSDYLVDKAPALAAGGGNR